MLSLFQCATGEGWNTIMHDAMHNEAKEMAGDCDPDDGSCGSWLAVPFFVSFVVLSSFIVLKMLIAVILEKYLEALGRDANVLQAEHKDSFLEAWGKLDPKATSRLSVSQLADVVWELPPPLGLDPKEFDFKKVSRSNVLAYLLRSDLRCHPPASGVGPPEVHFADVLSMLIKDSYRKDEGEVLLDKKTGSKKSHDWGSVLPDPESKLGRQLRARLEKEESKRSGSGEGMLVSEHLAAVMLADALRRGKENAASSRRRPRASLVEFSGPASSRPRLERPGRRASRTLAVAGSMITPGQPRRHARLAMAVRVLETLSARGGILRAARDLALHLC